RESPSGSTRGRGGYLEGTPGRSTTTTRSAWQLFGPARASSTGKALTSMAVIRSILGSLVRFRLLIWMVLVGRIRIIRAATIFGSVGVTAGAMDPYRAPGPITRTSIVTTT